MKRYAPLILALVVGALVRLLPAGVSLGGDDGVALYIARVPWREIVPLMDGAGEVHPPLYFYWLHLWMLLGGPVLSQSEVWLRLASILPALLTIGVVWAVAEAALGAVEAGVAASFMAISSYAVTFGDEVRMYALAALWVCLAAWGLWRLRPGPDWLYVVAATLALYTHYLTGFALLGLQAVLLLHDYPWRRLLLANLGVILLFAPWVPHVLDQASHSMALRDPPPAMWFPELMFQMAFGWSLPRPLAGWEGPYSLDPLKWIGVLLPATIAWALWQKPRSRVGMWLTVAWLVPILLAAGISTFTQTRIFEFKYFSLVSPILALLLGWSYSRISPPAMRHGLTVIVVSINLYSLTLLWADPGMGPQDWRSTAGFVGPRLVHGDTILVQPGMFSAALSIYLSRYQNPGDVQFLAQDQFPTVAMTGRVWLIDTPYHPEVRQVDLDGWLRAHRFQPDANQVFDTFNFFPANRIHVQLYVDPQVRK